MHNAHATKWNKHHPLKLNRPRHHDRKLLRLCDKNGTWPRVLFIQFKGALHVCHRAVVCMINMSYAFNYVILYGVAEDCWRGQVLCKCSVKLIYVPAPQTCPCLSYQRAYCVKWLHLYSSFIQSVTWMLVLGIWCTKMQQWVSSEYPGSSSPVHCVFLC